MRLSRKGLTPHGVLVCSRPRLLPLQRRAPFSTSSTTAASTSASVSASPLLAAPPPYKVLLFCSGDFALPSLQALVANLKLGSASPQRVVSHLEVVCTADKQHARSHSAKQAKLALEKAATKAEAERHGIPIHQLPAHMDIRMTGWSLPNPVVTTFAESAYSGPFDLGVVVSFGYFLPPHVISGFRLGTLNVHPAALPKYRGASPVQSALWADEPVTAVTTTTVHPTAFDHGLVIDSFPVPIPPFVTYQSFNPVMAQHCADRILHTLTNFQTLAPRAAPQPTLLRPSLTTPTPATASPALRAILEKCRAPRLNSQVESRIDFTSESADAIWRRAAALTGYYPLHAKFRGGSVILTELVHPAQLTAQPSPPLPSAMTPGQFAYDPANRVLWVQCAPPPAAAATPLNTPAIPSGRIAVRQLQIATKKQPMTAQAFANGYLLRRDATNAANKFATDCFA